MPPPLPVVLSGYAVYFFLNAAPGFMGALFFQEGEEEEEEEEGEDGEEEKGLEEGLAGEEAGDEAGDGGGDGMEEEGEGSDGGDVRSIVPEVCALLCVCMCVFFAGLAYAAVFPVASHELVVCHFFSINKKTMFLLIK